ncbi:MAG: 2'-5' RNA ligase family protein [Planctomycetes bacterium]|nr:2'-5' RNA ligase family protein [Planctomycetota bacterium]
MIAKTHRTAVVAIPPQEVWAPIQVIRQEHDRQFRRWMPHINLLYPFVSTEQFGEAAPRLTDVCARIAPFAIALSEFRMFRHPSGTATLWLAPEPAQALIALQAALQAAFPECDDLSRFPAGFTPHLSVGQARTAHEAEQLLHHLQQSWQPICFDLDALAMIRRQQDGPFVIDRWVSLVASAL